MRKPKWLTKAVAMVCLLALCVCAAPAATVLADEDLDAEIARLQKELEEINSNIAALQGDIAGTAEAKRQYELQQQALEDLLAANRDSISETQAAIAEKQIEIGAKIQSVYAQQQLFEERMVAVYKNRNEGVLSTLLSVNSFSELLTVSNSLQRITQHDTELIESLSAEKTALELEQQELENLVNELDQKNAKHEQGIQQLAGSIAAQNDTLDDLQAKKAAEEAVGDDKESELEAAQRERAEQQAEADRMAQEAAENARKRQEAEEEQRRREEEKNNQSNDENNGDGDGDGEDGEEGDGGNEGGADPDPEPPVDIPQHNGEVYHWPVPGHYSVSCEFGSPDPDGKGHRGMDINDGSINGATVEAAGPGTVLRAGWHGSWGNYVSIDHGNGLVTLYAHLQGYTVGVGQYVEAGNVVGYVGNTGFVFGANGGYHLHFEVQINGVCQNPRNYVSA